MNITFKMYIHDSRIEAIRCLCAVNMKAAALMSNKFY